MIVFAPYAIHDAFASWLLDAPPIAHHHPAPIAMEAVRFGPYGKWPTLQAHGGSHAIVGVSPSRWMCIANLAWRYFVGSYNDFMLIAAACNLAQTVVLSDRAWFDTAVLRHERRPSLNHIGGLLRMKGADGRQWVRLGDISRIEIKAALHRLLADRPDAKMHLCYTFGAHRMDETFVDAEVWWRFTRGWTDRSSLE